MNRCHAFLVCYFSKKFIELVAKKKSFSTFIYFWFHRFVLNQEIRMLWKDSKLYLTKAIFSKRMRFNSWACNLRALMLNHSAAEAEAVLVLVYNENFPVQFLAIHYLITIFVLRGQFNDLKILFSADNVCNYYQVRWMCQNFPKHCLGCKIVN